MRSPPDPPARQTGWGSHAALVGRLGELHIEDLWTSVADYYPRVTVVAVADAFCAVVPVSAGLGAVAIVRKPPDSVALSQAVEAARRFVELAPPTVLVDHLVARSWAEARRYVQRHGHSHVLLADRPLGPLARALARRPEWWGLPTGSGRLVLLDQSGSSATPR
jgi:hypothetical protein